MLGKLNEWIGWFNQCGDGFWRFAAGMFWQVVVLVAILICLDLLLKRRSRAIVRYWLWTLVLVKLVLPVQFSTPVSVGYWIAAKGPIALEDKQFSASPAFPQVAMVKNDVVDPAVDFALQHGAKTEGDAATSAGSVGHFSPSSASLASSSGPTPELTRPHWKAFALAAWLVVVTVMLGMVIRRALVVRQIVDAASARAGGIPRPRQGVFGGSWNEGAVVANSDFRTLGQSGNLRLLAADHSASTRLDRPTGARTDTAGNCT